MRSAITLLLGFVLLGVNSAVAVCQDEKADEPSARSEKAREINYLQKRLQNLLAEEQELEEENAPTQALSEVREQIMQIEQVLKKAGAFQQLRRPRFDEDSEKLDAAVRRIQYIRAAAANLKKAELGDLAAQLLKAADGMEQEVRKAMLDMKKAQARREGPGLAGVVDELREEVEKLRDEVQDLRQELKQR